MVQRMSIEEFRKGNFEIKKSKYGNKKTEYRGVVYDSKREAEYAKALEASMRAIKRSDKVILVERQIRYSIEIQFTHICDYIADFRVTYADGRVEIIDVKGFKTAIYRIKKKLVFACYGITIIEV